MQNHYLTPVELKALKAIKNCNDKYDAPYALNSNCPTTGSLQRAGLIDFFPYERGYPTACVAVSGGEATVYMSITVKGVTALHEHEEDAA